MVKWRINPISPNLMKVIRNIIPAQIKYIKNLKEKGKILAEYTLDGKDEGFGILDVESSEELNEIIANAPSSSIVRYEVFPLTDFENSLKSWEKFLERVMK
ncbi:MAG: muconolactone Delta-isomerase family protein [Candidatus Methylarchaceae archaeon HK02M2]|nr:muconolactone Delta-isomerase family protein [Candidatus Methylarchaceae archaeon HK02M2]